MDEVHYDSLKECEILDTSGLLIVDAVSTRKLRS
jgi:hypothetical protein